MLVSIPLIAANEELTGAIAPLSVSLVIGAFVFGAAMQIADGCGSGTLYKAGLGNGFSLAVLPGFIAGSFLGAAHLDRWLALGSLPPVSLPEHLGVGVALAGATRGARRTRHVAMAQTQAHRHALARARDLRCRRVARGVRRAESDHRRPTMGHRLRARPVGREDRHVVRRRSGRQRLLGKRSASDAHRIVTADRRDFGDQHRAADRRVDRCQFSRPRAACHQASGKQWLVAVVTGLVLGYSARLAFGCNVGAYFSGISTGSLHGWVWFAAAFAGSFVGIPLRERLGAQEHEAHAHRYFRC